MVIGSRLSRWSYGKPALTALSVVTLLASAPTAKAETSFIRQFLAAKGGCTFELDFVLTGGGVQAPFGKPAEQWTDADLDRLTQELASCQAEAEATGNKFTVAQVARTSHEIASRMPEIVRRARAEDERQKEQLEARTAMANEAVNQSDSDLDRLREQADAAEARAAHAKADAELQQQSLHRRIEAADEAVSRTREQIARLQSETERKEQDAAQAKSRADAAEIPDRSGAENAPDSSDAAKTGDQASRPAAQQTPAPVVSGEQRAEQASNGGKGADRDKSTDVAGPNVPLKTDAVRPQNGTADAGSASEFDLSPEDMLARLSHEPSGSVIKPVLKNTVTGKGRSIRTYMVGETNAIYFTEDEISGRVKEFVVLLSRSTTEQMTLGLLTFVSMLDVVSPKLTQDDRGQIAQDILQTVLTSEKVYSKDMDTYRLVCRPVSGVWCSFVPNP